MLDGIDRLNETGDSDNLCEELGDVLFQVVLHSLIAQEEGIFTIEDVISGITDKMQFRHPKIFAPEDRELCSLSWEALKAKERSAKIIKLHMRARCERKSLDNLTKRVYI